MMEYEQRLEAAARRLCEIRGQNPEERVSFRTPGDLTLAMRYRALWKNVADELRVAVERVKISQLLTEYDLI
jgi:hypothetical protein